MLPSKPTDQSVQPGNRYSFGTFSIDDDCFVSQHTDDASSAAAVYADIMKIKSELKYFCSLQVPNPEQSSTTTSDTDLVPCTSLELSCEVPFDDTVLEEIIRNIKLPANLDDDDWPADFSPDTFEQLLTPQADMTFKELSDMSMQHDDDYFPHVGMTTDVSSAAHDENTSSAASSVSEDNERDDVNRRGLKKSGGPVRKLARFGNKQVIKYSDEYHDRRVKNNEAVKKSRTKAKEKQKESETKMVQLASENRTLTDRVDLLMKELQVLKSLYKELNQDLPASAVRALERANVR